jgi:hypothetical protein
MSFNFITYLCENIIANDDSLIYGNKEDENKNTDEIEITNKKELLTEFFNNINNVVKSNKKIGTFREMFGIEGFTLAYGNFMNKKILDVNYNSEKDDYERMKNDFSIFKKEIKNRYKNINNINIYRLPCCWSKKTNFNSFIGINIYPFIWSKNRFFWKEETIGDNIVLKLKSANDRWIMRKDIKEKLLQDLSQYNKYILPSYIKNDIKNMRDCFFSEETNLKEALFLSNYFFNDEWSEILNNVFQNLIKDYSEMIELETGNQGLWCLIPNDCYFCT